MKTFKDTRFGDMTGKQVGYGIEVYNEDLDSLEGSPEVIRGNFDVTDNNLTSLKGSPVKIFGNFSCYNNKITSLEYGPEIVTGNYDVGADNNLTSLKGAPMSVGGDFTIYGAEVTSFEHAPITIGKRFTCQKCKNVKNQVEQIVQYGIKADEYWTDEGKFLYKDIEEKIAKYKEMGTRITRPSMRTLLGLK